MGPSACSVLQPPTFFQRLHVYLIAACSRLFVGFLNLTCVKCSDERELRRRDGAAITAAPASWQMAFERLSLPCWLESSSGRHGREHHQNLAG